MIPDLAELVALRGPARTLRLSSLQPSARSQGPHRSAQRGRGLEFEEVRPYAAGDDARSIDWRVTARRGRPHTRLYREERGRPTWLAVDLHAGLFFGSRRQLKSALALRAAALLAWQAALNGDRLGAAIADGTDPVQVLPTRAREAGVLPVLEALVERQPQAPAIPADTGLKAALRALQPLVHPGSLVWVLSDFAGLDDESEAHLARLAASSTVRLLWITDPLEREGLPGGRFRIGLPGRSRWFDGDGSRAGWQQAWRARETRLGSVADRLQADLLRLETPDEASAALALALRETAHAA